MNIFFKIVSYIFHPLFVPVIGTLTYFAITPKYSPIEMQGSTILPIFILTVIIPIISFYILRNLGVIYTVFLSDISERKYPLYINLALLLMILLKVLPNNYISEVYFYFAGLTIATLTTLLLLFLKFKSSIHLMGIGSVWMYLIALSFHFEVNIILAISITTLIAGLVASSRLYTKAHSKIEIITGLIIGITSQLLTLKFWL